MNFIIHIALRWLSSYVLGWLGCLPKIFWAFFFVFVITSAMTWKFYDLRYNGETATGVIVGSSGQNGVQLENPKWVQFKTQDGKEHSAKLTFSAFYTMGAEMDVHYDKVHPINSYANSHWNSWGIFTFGLLILVVGGGTVIRAANKTAKIERQYHEEKYSDSVHYDAPKPPAKDGCIANTIKVLAVIMLIVGITTSYKYLVWYHTGESVTAKVVTSKRPNLRAESGAESKSLFALDHNGDVMFFRGIKLEDHNIGDEVTVLYDKKNPNNHMEKNPLNAYGVLLASLFFMLYAWGPWLIRRIVYYIQCKTFENKKT